MWKCESDRGCRERKDGSVRVQKRILEFVKEHRLLERGDRLVVGVSGGADSVCLLRMLHILRDDYELELYAVHVNHGLRGEEAERDEKFVQALCETLEIPCDTIQLDIRSEAKRMRLSEEEAGREWRYRCFAEVAERRGCNKVAVAHHMEDNAETVLFRMFRGTGIQGLAGIAPCSPMPDGGDIRIVRPLLCVSRAEIEGYLQELAQSYCVDSTNADENYSRNRIRNSILPLATEYINAQTVRNLNTLAHHAGRAAEYLQRQADALYERCARVEEMRIVFSLKQEEEPVLLELALRNALYELAGKKRDISTVHVEALQRLCSGQVGSRLDLPYGIVARKSYDCIELYRAGTQETEQETFCEQPKVRDGEQTVVYLPDGGNLIFSIKHLRDFGADAYREIIKIAQNDYTKCFDYDKIKDNISVRTPKMADFLCLYQDGRGKLLKDYLVDAKVPLSKRNRLCLVAEGDSVLWIPGLRAGEGYRVRPDTERILLIEWNIQ